MNGVSASIKYRNDLIVPAPIHFFGQKFVKWLRTFIKHLLCILTNWVYAISGSLVCTTDPRRRIREDQEASLLVVKARTYLNCSNIGDDSRKLSVEFLLNTYNVDHMYISLWISVTKTQIREDFSKQPYNTNCHKAYQLLPWFV